MSKLSVPDPKSSLIESPLAKVVTGEIPVVRAVATYWVENVRSRRDRELYDFLSDVVAAIEDLQQRTEGLIDSDHMSGEDFIDTLANLTEVSVRNSDKSKRNYLVNFAVNYSTYKRPDTTLRQVFYQLVDELSGMHLVLLDKVYGAQREFSDEDLRVLVQQSSRPEALSVSSLSVAIGVSEDLMSVLVSTLVSKGLIETVSAPSHLSDHSIRIIMQPVTRRFMKFLHLQDDEGMQ